MPKAELVALEKRLAEASGADRVADGVFWKMCDPEAFERNCSFYGMKYAGHVHTKAEKREHIRARSEYLAPAYTSSIDSALTLAFRTLTPLGFLSWGIDGTQKDYNVGWVAVNADGGLLEGRAEHKTPALAICLAIVRALAKSPEQSHE